MGNYSSHFGIDHDVVEHKSSSGSNEINVFHILRREFRAKVKYPARWNGYKAGCLFVNEENHLEFRMDVVVGSRGSGAAMNGTSSSISHNLQRSVGWNLRERPCKIVRLDCDKVNLEVFFVNGRKSVIKIKGRDVGTMANHYLSCDWNLLPTEKEIALRELEHQLGCVESSSPKLNSKDFKEACTQTDAASCYPQQSGMFLDKCSQTDQMNQPRSEVVHRYVNWPLPFGIIPRKKSTNELESSRDARYKRPVFPSVSIRSSHRPAGPKPSQYANIDALRTKALAAILGEHKK